VLPDGELAEKAARFAARLAGGPTLANAATKRVVRAYLDGGVAAADERVIGEAAALFGTDDLKAAVRSFLENGPGKATFEGR
jgi:enoyl-CoA hydratase/carnithine racemase